MKYLNKFAFLSLLITTLPVQAISNDDFLTAHSIYLTATNSGEEADIEQAEQQLAKLTLTGPEHELIDTYLGSLESLKATTVFFPWNKMKHVDQGVEMMDRALESINTPHQQTLLAGVAISLRMQLICAHTYFAFPRFLNRFQDAKDLVADILESPQLADANTLFKNALYLLAADIAKDEDNIEQQQQYLKLIQVQQVKGESP